MTKIGALYWKYIPSLFKWWSDIDLKPCPLNKNYQLVRNILAACVRDGGQIEPENGHAVLVYDERNPAFQKDGKGYKAFEKTRSALRNPSLLKKCSWQKIINGLKQNSESQWLTEALHKKYGL